MKKLFNAVGGYFRRTDYWLILSCIICSALSLMLLVGIYIDENIVWNPVKTQIYSTVLGLLFMVILSKIDYRFTAKMWKLHVPLAWVLGILPFFIGQQRTGYENVDDKSWIRIGGVGIQPSELLKISFIMSFAFHLSLLKGELNKPKNVLLLCLHGAAPVLLIHFQGDDGSALIFALIFAIMIFTAGLSWKYIVPAIGAVAVAVPVMWVTGIINEEQKLRFLSLLFPNDPQYERLVYQQNRGIISIGSGGVWGKGIFGGGHRYVPEMHNDFIFSFAGEAIGFVGCLGIILLISIICLKVLFNSRRSLDALGHHVCIGVFAMFATQSIINLGMNLGVIPVIGVTLPFLSAGGSSVLSAYLGVGLVLSVYQYNTKGLFADNVGG